VKQTGISVLPCSA